MDKKQTYIIGVCCTENNGISLGTVHGTQEQVKDYLVSLVKGDKLNDEHSYECGTESPKEVEVDKDGYMNAFANYYDYHIDYTAVLLGEPLDL